MRLERLIGVALFFAACSRRDSREDSLDTVMVFEATPAGAPTDSSKASVPKGPIMAVMQTMAAYYDHRITAESAATVLVDYQQKTHKPLNLEMDDALLAAMRRETAKRSH